MNDLRKVMIDNGLSTDQVAKLLDRKKNTVEVWLSKDTKRQIPQHMFELLKFKIQTKSTLHK